MKAVKESPAHTRAWIETAPDRRRKIRAPSPAHTRAWIETRSTSPRSPTTVSPASPAHTRAWIETNQRLCPCRPSRVARSHAGVD